MKRILCCLIVSGSLLAQVMAQETLKSQPAGERTWGTGCRSEQAGWIILHIEGEPFERGVQHGRLMAPEIAGYLRCFAQTLNHKAPNEHWRGVRPFIQALFVRKFDLEYLEEMKGIAEGASAAGARFDGRPIDLIDILALNCWCEIQGLEEANAATPTGLEGITKAAPRPANPLPHFERCSAFVAAGPATSDGKIVFGHVTMYELYPAGFCNVWIDVKPARGRRFVMCSFPGGMQSSMDYYINDAGILLAETSLPQTRFNIDGMTCASRVRKAIQYADTIDRAVEILARDNNGLYTNEWLLADVNTNEIAMFELGTGKSKLWRSSKNEWFGGTPGFYWSCNNCKDMEVRMETIASPKGRPGNVVFQPSDRDIAWVKLYEKYRGRIGADFVKDFCASDVLTAPTGLDAKVTTTDLAKEMKTYASFGPPNGTTRNPTVKEKQKYPEIKPLVKSPWTMLGPKTPSTALKVSNTTPSPDDSELAWRGTLLPQTDADIWLATAFADYHEMVVAEKRSLRQGNASKLRESLQECRKRYLDAAKTGEVALVDIKQSAASDEWYRLASAKGVLLLHQLRCDVGAERFDQAMDEFGMKHGGERVNWRAFHRHMESATGRNLDAFFAYWMRAKGLPVGAP